jgi:hypothetical protein
MTATKWKAPQPRELPVLRGRLAGWLADAGPQFYGHMVMAGRQSIRPLGVLAESATRLAIEERRRVMDGDLYAVSADMTELARHAGTQLSGDELYPHDLPSAAGFMVFGEPIASYDSEGFTAEIVAVSWGITHDLLTIDVGPFIVPVGSSWACEGAVWFTFYTDPLWFITSNLATADASAIQAGPFLPDNELIWPFGEVDHPWSEAKDSVAPWARTVVAAWLLMTQPLVTEERQRSDRPARRRLQRWGVPDRDVRIIHVRRPDHSQARRQGDSTAGREYTCQWWVTGHWRRYHVGPGRTRVQRRYIAPHLAGPDDMPVQGTERVRVWDR